MSSTKDIYCTKSQHLVNKKIVFCVTGSIAAVESVKTIRELIRHGAEVYTVITPNGCKIISPETLKYASGNAVITEITGSVEHISLCTGNNKADIVVVAPATANTISKIVSGIDDTCVTTICTTAIGSNIPILIVPAMHLSMYEHKILLENIAKLKNIGIEFIEPRIAEARAKYPDIETIVARIIRKLSTEKYTEKRVLLIGGASREYIDDVRIITNVSSGKTAVELANALYLGNAKFTFYYGHGVEPPNYIEAKRFTTINSLIDLLKKEDYNKYDTIILCAALSDFTINKHTGKLPSNKSYTITLKPAKKLIKEIRKSYTGILVGFKLVSEEKNIIEKCFEYLKMEKLDFVVGNALKNITFTDTKVVLIDKNKNIVHYTGPKSVVAEKLLQKLYE